MMWLGLGKHHDDLAYNILRAHIPFTKRFSLFCITLMAEQRTFGYNYIVQISC